MNEATAKAWEAYWQAYKSGDVVAMQRAYERIEPLQRVANARRSTTKMLAALLG